jgi:hypothetical protein
MIRLAASVPPTSRPTAKNSPMRVSSMVLNTDRKPTSPNHSHST